MVNRAVPDAPLSHPDEAEHRRLIAMRANAIGYEVGEFTPTFTFATPGDLSVSYGRQDGYYWRLGSLVYVKFRMDFTPTHTTASGQGRISLPFLAVAGRDDHWPLSHTANLSYPTGVSVVLARPTNNTTYLRLIGYGDGVGETDLGPTELSTGTGQSLFSNGFYPI